MQPLTQDASLTPRTDAVERFFYEPGRPPVGFVDSGVARQLEVELGRALTQLRTHGVEPPPPLDSRLQAALQSGRRPVGSFFSSMAQAASGALPMEPAVQMPKVRFLTPATVSESLGKARGYDDGAVLYRQGEMAEHVFVVLQGQVLVSPPEDGGADRLWGSGQVLGEHAIFDEGLHTETVQAAGQVRCVLIPSDQLRSLIAGDTSGLAQVLMALVLEYRMTSAIAAGIAAAAAVSTYEVLGQKTYTGPEIHRALVEAKTQAPGQGLSSSQQMCLRLQTSELMPTRPVPAGTWLARAGEVNSGLMLVHGQAQLNAGTHTLLLGQGSVIGVAESLTGQDLPWEVVAQQDVNARSIPVERVLQKLERADPRLKGLASHLCERILALQTAC